MANSARVIGCGVLLVVALVGCDWRRGQTDAAASAEAVKRAHSSYVSAINSNNAEAWLASLSEDVTYFVPNRKAVVGRAAVGEWIASYLQEVTTRWTKQVDDLQVQGDLAFGRYTFTASDSVIIRDPETEGGGTANDSGWGLVMYRRERDGVWRVVRDAWGTDRPAR